MTVFADQPVQGWLIDLRGPAADAEDNGGTRLGSCPKSVFLIHPNNLSFADEGAVA